MVLLALSWWVSTVLGQHGVCKQAGGIMHTWHVLALHGKWLAHFVLRVGPFHIRDARRDAGVGRGAAGLSTCSSSLGHGLNFIDEGRENSILGRIFFHKLLHEFGHSLVCTPSLHARAHTQVRQQTRNERHVRGHRPSFV